MSQLDRDNYLQGTPDNDVLYALAAVGSYYIRGFDGNDQIIGAEGDDYLEGGNGHDHITGLGGNDTLIGGDGNDYLGGGIGLDYLAGGNGNDILSGGADNDYLDGGAGADTLVGGTGNDTYLVDSTSDVVTELPGEGMDSVRSLISYTLGANVENLYLQGTGHLSSWGNALNNILVGNTGNNLLLGGDGNDYIAGGAGSDYLAGENGNDYILGGDGNDYLNGGAGADTLIGGAGNDIYSVDNEADVVIENPNEGTHDTVQALISYTLGDNVENLELRAGKGHLTGTGNELDNRITGNEGNNFLFGHGGNDTLIGNDGADFLVGDAGDDKLYGGNGGDVLIGGTGSNFLAGGAGNDLYTFLAGLTDGNNAIDDASGTSDWARFTGFNANDTLFAANGNTLLLTLLGGYDVSIANYFDGEAMGSGLIERLVFDDATLVFDGVTGVLV